MEARPPLRGERGVARRERRCEPDRARTPRGPGLSRVLTNDLQPGARVRVVRLGLRGALLRYQGDRALIETERGSVSVPAAEIEPLADDTSSAREGETRITLEDNARREELDLHGATVAEVEPRVGAFIDQAVIRGLWRVRIIHGTGEGKILAEARRCLKAHPAVRSFEFAAPREGSVGATVVVIA